MRLTLHATISTTASQSLHFLDGHLVEVAVDGMLQGTGSHGELKGLTLCLFCQQTMNQTT